MPLFHYTNEWAKRKREKSKGLSKVALSADLKELQSYRQIRKHTLGILVLELHVSIFTEEQSIPNASWNSYESNHTKKIIPNNWFDGRTHTTDTVGSSQSNRKLPWTTVEECACAEAYILLAQTRLRGGLWSRVDSYALPETNLTAIIGAVGWTSRVLAASSRDTGSNCLLREHVSTTGNNKPRLSE
ncbi:hypothetical protein B0O99DRAFT_677707 [Bisporella sp. PMI_857]|nr:hypothetical protein B0O99DRAFT_677707 [Bisporella sp. PMI_857]